VIVASNPTLVDAPSGRITSDLRCDTSTATNKNNKNKTKYDNKNHPRRSSRSNPKQQLRHYNNNTIIPSLSSAYSVIPNSYPISTPRSSKLPPILTPHHHLLTPAQIDDSSTPTPAPKHPRRLLRVGQCVVISTLRAGIIVIQGQKYAIGVERSLWL
jgi:hypothetical protein